MTYQLSTCWCRRCKAATPHELSEDGQRAQCITCRERRPQRHEAFRFHNDPTNTKAFIAALDGMGNRGEK